LLITGCFGDTEIADKCEGVNGSAETISGSTYDLPWLWSNKNHTCLS
jgi:hypothetical protein